MSPSRLVTVLGWFVCGCGAAAAPAAPAPLGATAAPTDAGAPTAVDAAASAATECEANWIPAGPDKSCVKLCESDAECKAKELCAPTSWDMGGGAIAHARACF